MYLVLLYVLKIMLVEKPKSPVGLHRIWKQYILPMMSVSGMACMHNVLAHVLVFTVRARPKYACSSKVDSSSNATFMTLFLKHPFHERRVTDKRTKGMVLYVYRSQFLGLSNHKFGQKSSTEYPYTFEPKLLNPY